MSKKYTVYGLVDPRFPDVVRYVGATSMALKKRLSGHCSGGRKFIRITESQKWVGALMDEGVTPKIIPLEECAQSEATITEGKWIGFFRPGLTNFMVPAFVPGDFSLEEKLKKWRGRYAQKQAAACLGVSLSTYQNWEYGDNMPSVLAMKEIDRAIQNPLSEWVKTVEPNAVLPEEPQEVPIGHRLLRWRGDRTQKEAAKILGVSAVVIGRLEATNQGVGARTIKKLLSAMQASPSPS